MNMFVWALHPLEKMFGKITTRIISGGNLLYKCATNPSKCYHKKEAHNSLFNYDIISLCETNLNDTIELPTNLFYGFKSIFSHHPSGNKHGGVALFFQGKSPTI